MQKKSRLAATFTSAAVLVGMCASNLAFAQGELDVGDLTTLEKTQTLSGTAISNSAISTNEYKSTAYNNQISSEVFCADPTSIEYNGRLYVFGTNDHQQCNEKGEDQENTYEKIKSLVIFSTDDMVNYVYHGEINVGKVAPWITNSWAPSITSRVEEDGLTHFYLYFSNNGMGTGVITATDPLGPWTDPLGKPLVSGSTPGLTGCPNPFDPGVVIDENGDGWLSFGGGKASNGSDYMPGSARIVKLGDDMVSLASDIAEIPAPYFFEASELNYINGTYVYTYNTDWSDHSAKWDYDCPVPSQCSMVYMTSKTPLDPTSWEMKGECFKNPGTAGFDYSNNHTHLQKYKDNYYMLYHTLMLKSNMGISGGYRSLNVDKISVDEENVTIEKTGGTKKGVSAVNSLNPFIAHLGAELNNTADMTFDTTNMSEPFAVADKAGAWTSVRSVEFTESEEAEDEAPQEQAEPTLTGVNTIEYRMSVKSVDKATTITMYPATADGDCEGSVDVDSAGDYTLTCDLGGQTMIKNLGYFRASDGAKVTFNLESIIINGEYEFDISSELTNERDWADGLKNIWNDFSDGDEIYTSDSAVFKYIASDDSIEFFVLPATSGGNIGSFETLDNLVFLANVKGTGRIEVRLDSPTGDLLTSVDFDSADEFTTIYNEEVAEIGATHDLYFVYSDSSIAMKMWQFADSDDYNNVTPNSSSSSQPTSETSGGEGNKSSSSTASSSKASSGTSGKAADTSPSTGVEGAAFTLFTMTITAAGVVATKKKK